MSQYKDLFVSEVKENLQNLSSDLLNLEKDSENKDILNALMRYSHSIKGASATMGYTKMALLTHLMEDIFDYARNDKLKINSEIIDLVLQSIDKITESLVQIVEKNEEMDITEEAENLKKITGVAPSEIKIVKQVKSGESKKKTPEVNLADYINVPIKRLDALLDLTEELIIEKLFFDDLYKKLEGENNKQYPELKNEVNRLNRIVSDIQHQVIELRLVPIDVIFIHFTRMVRDLAGAQKKQVDFNIKGGELELDRSIIEKMADPITHMIRNSIDHGIEQEGTIQINAKREKGYAIISIEDNGKGINLEKLIEKAVKMNLITENDKKLYQKAIPAKRPVMMPKIFDSILFNSHISTSEKVTEISGRGVGLNVVREFLDSVGGIIEVEILEKGTRFNIQIPFSLAIINALILKVGNSLYALPLSSIKHTVIVQNSDIKKVLDKDVAVIEGNDVPLISLKKIFGIKFDDGKNSKNIVILIQVNNDVFGLVVDELAKEEEIIVKPIPTVFKKSKVFSGVTILGKGQAVPIIDTAGLISDLIPLT